jgi:hypothetical protein
MAPIAEASTACPRCRSGWTSRNSTSTSSDTRFACGSSLTIDQDGEQADLRCAPSDEPICSNCDGGGCVCVVVRDWESAARCSGRCCPFCAGSGNHAHD